MRRIIILLALASLALAERRGVTSEDYFSFESVNDPQISPDGKWVAYTVTVVDQKANRRMSRVWVSSLERSQTASETSETVSSTSPRWSPDGKYLAFTSARDGGRPQIWLLS